MSNASQDYITYRINKSAETFADAKLLAENGRWNSSVNRLYYSSFYLISALINKSGIRAESHTGVKTQFNLH
ncbi:MAG: HEPN domain-containing protein [Chitinophagaceae bacterium]|nr:HEPN domain-containing protein [Chitinophagaceae bacterium]